MIRTLSLFYLAQDLPSGRLLFEAVLDCEFVPMKHLESATYWSAPLPDGTVLELWPAGGRPMSRVQLEFEIPDLDVAAERLDAARFEVRQISGTVLVVDPNDNVIALVENRGGPNVP